jgi:hypothetical protein
MAFDAGIKLRSTELYLQLHSVSLVHEKICKEYLPVLGEEGLPALITVRKWIEGKELPEVVKNMGVEVIVKTRLKEIEKQIETKERDERVLNEIIEKGSKEMGEMEFTSAEGAAKAAESAINSSRKLANQTINLQFVTDVLDAIKLTIVDEDMRRTLGIEIRKIFQKYSKE